MGTPTVTLIPRDPDAPITGPAGELLQPVTVADQQIRLRPPTQAAIEAEKAYITISFYEAGRRRNTSGGVTLDEALVTVQELIDRISSGAVNAPKTMGELIERYLDPDRIPESGEGFYLKFEATDATRGASRVRVQGRGKPRPYPNRKGATFKRRTQP